MSKLLPKSIKTGSIIAFISVVDGKTDPSRHWAGSPQCAHDEFEKLPLALPCEFSLIYPLTTLMTWSELSLNEER